MYESYLDGTEVTGGYSRAIKVGNRIIVSGTTSLDAEGNVVGVTGAEQTERSMAKILDAIARFGAGIEHIININIYITDASEGRTIAETMARLCHPHRPAATAVIVAGLTRPGLKVELQAEAVV